MVFNVFVPITQFPYRNHLYEYQQSALNAGLEVSIGPLGAFIINLVKEDADKIVRALQGRGVQVFLYETV